ncbi:hypothetical protein [Geobacter sp. AOG1]|nr:hypothetical protein [Geobacter sp. AOG1]
MKRTWVAHSLRGLCKPLLPRRSDTFDEIYVRRNTGIGMAKAIDH